MIRTLLLCALLVSVAGSGPAFGWADAPDEIVLNIDDNTAWISIVDTLLNRDTLLSFEYWYDADPFPKSVHANYTPQELHVGRNPVPYSAILQPLSQSTEWCTALIPLSPEGSDAQFCMPVRTMGDYYTMMDCGSVFNDHVINSVITIRNIESFRDYDAYCAYIRDHDDGQDGDGDNIDDGDNGTDGEPVPEPATLAMMGTGLLGLLGFELQRRKAAK